MHCVPVLVLLSVVYPDVCLSKSRPHIPLDVECVSISAIKSLNHKTNYYKDSYLYGFPRTLSPVFIHRELTFASNFATPREQYSFVLVRSPLFEHIINQSIFKS